MYQQKCKIKSSFNWTQCDMQRLLNNKTHIYIYIYIYIYIWFAFIYKVLKY